MISEDSEVSEECKKMELIDVSSDTESDLVEAYLGAEPNKAFNAISSVSERKFVRIGKQMSLPKPNPVLTLEPKWSKTPPVEEQLRAPYKTPPVKEQLRTPYKKDLLICDRCGKFFKSTTNLMMHQRRHTGVKDHACTYCSLRFVNSYLLKVHERVRHLGEKPYACRFCEMRFCTSSVRRQHERVKHIPDPQYECDECGSKFKTKTDLNKHKFLHTGQKPFRCDMCNMNFARRNTLKQHYKTPIHQRRATSIVDAQQAYIIDDD